jgi:hypothetical protein
VGVDPGSESTGTTSSTAPTTSTTGASKTRDEAGDEARAPEGASDYRACDATRAR